MAYLRKIIKRLIGLLVALCAFGYVWILTILSEELKLAIGAGEARLGYNDRQQIRHVFIQSTAKTVTKTYDPSFWESNRDRAEELLRRNGPPSVRRILTAYLEPKLNDTIPGTGRPGNFDEPLDAGVPPDFYIPLPLRTTTPEDLRVYEYAKVQTCHDLTTHFPVDRGLRHANDPITGKPVPTTNVLDEPTPPNYPWDEAPYCPVEADPFLPWIHDVFPSFDGSRVEFVAQNRRRCKTGANFVPDLERLTPQSALLQPVSVKRINQTEAQQLAPSLWNPTVPFTSEHARYRLAHMDEASEDGMWTRFICRFHTTNFASGKPLILGETLSRFPFNYDYVAYRKNRPYVLTPRGSDSNLFWTSTLLFHCPVPSHLRKLIANGESILSDGTPTLHVDIVPIRTSVRYGGAEAYFNEELAGPKHQWATDTKDRFYKGHDASTPLGFDPHLRWGSQHVLPRVEASGRWENIPICRSPSVPFVGQPEASKFVKASTDSKDNENETTITTTKPYFLSACLWASASFQERGSGVQGKEWEVDTETKPRLREWIEFHLMVGVDHIFVYDNSGANTNETNLADITDQFPMHVTRIDWPSQVCNNRKPGLTNPGERSSQYAAENSCRVRYGPFTEWMASFDTDEYLFPMGNFSSLQDVVRQAQATGINILSFPSARSKLRADATEEIGLGRIKTANATFLEAYNCDPVPLPKPSWAKRAKKQIYRPDYVLNRFVHYSTVTKGLVETYAEFQNRTVGRPWPRHYAEGTERFIDELQEAAMIHAKTIDWNRTKNYAKNCHNSSMTNRNCYVGYHWPINITLSTVEAGNDSMNASSISIQAFDEDGMNYNCYTNPVVETYWAPRLRSRLGLSAK